MMTCINQNCEQFGQELKEEIEECGLCGAKIGRIALKFNPGLVIPSIIAAAVSCAVYIAITLFMYDQGVVFGEDSVLLNIINLFMFGIYAAGIITAWISKSKKALAFAAISLPVIIFILRIIVL